MIWRTFVIALLLLTTACMKIAPPHGLASQDLASWKLAEVSATFEDNAIVSWRKINAEFVASLPPAERSAIESSVQARAPLPPEMQRRYEEYRSDQLLRRVRHVFGSEFNQTFVGTRPVKMHVRVTRLATANAFDNFLPNLAIAVLIGPPPPPKSVLEASVEIRDARSGAPLLSYKPIRMISSGPERVIVLSNGPFAGDAATDLLEILASEYAAWLLPAT